MHRSIKSKYGAIRTVIDGITFASKAEARRYSYLKLALAAGRIRNLKLQPKYELHVMHWLSSSPVKIGAYIADFGYEMKNGVEWVDVVEDVKGFKTPIYNWKKRHLRAEHGIEIREVPA